MIESYWPLVCGEARRHGRNLCLFQVSLFTVWELDLSLRLEKVILDVVKEYLSILYLTLCWFFGVCFSVESVGISDELKTKLKDVLIQEQQFTLGRMLGKGKNRKLDKALHWKSHLCYLYCWTGKCNYEQPVFSPSACGWQFKWNLPFCWDKTFRRFSITKRIFAKPFILHGSTESCTAVYAQVSKVLLIHWCANFFQRFK